jgi:hypothetical protein
LITPTGRSHATFLGNPNFVDDIDDIVNVLVRCGLFLSESLVASGPGDDADRIQLLVDPPCFVRFIPKKGGMVSSKVPMPSICNRERRYSIIA